MNPKSYLSVTIVAGRLGISDEQVLALIHDGKLNAFNVGLGTRRPRWRISPEDLANFLDSRRNRAPAAIPQRRRKTKIGEAIQFFE